MTQDIKDIAHMMGVEFSNAVKEAEQREAEELDSVLKIHDQAFQIYAERLDLASKRRTELLNELDKVYNEETLAAQVYTDQMAEVSARIKVLKEAKIGNKIQDEAVAQRGKAKFGVVS